MVRVGYSFLADATYQLREIRFAQSLFNDVFCRYDARHV